MLYIYKHAHSCAGTLMHTLYNEYKSLQITRYQALTLELVLNKSAHAYLWKHLGDILYEWHCGYGEDERRMVMYIDKSQMQWVLDVLQSSQS